jgi:hypothetical protein
MAAGMRILDWIIWFCNWLWGRTRRDSVSRVVPVASRDALPRFLGSALYVVGGDHPKWAVLKCPCGCGEVIDVNLMKSRSPFWTLSLKDGKATLKPSLWVPAERCGSHFFINDNRIDWV